MSVPAQTGRLYRGAQVLTMDPERPRAEALAEQAGRILAVGTEAECRAALEARGARFEAGDLGGGCLVPGFIDTHLHPVATIYFEQNVDLRGVGSIDALVSHLRAAAAETDAGWILGLQLDDEALTEQRFPTRHELDAACPDRPLVVMERDGHTAIGNTRALVAAGLTRATPDPDGGRIDREPDGSPAGPCREAATRLLLGAMPPVDLEAFRGGALRWFDRLASHGITSAGALLQTDAEGPGGEVGSVEAVAMQMLLPDAPFAVYSILMGADVDGVLAMRDTPLHDPARGHRLGGYKMFADGTFGACTACMRQPFADQPDRTGFMTLSEEEMFARMVRAHATGLQICIHAIGDEASRRCVDLYERLLAAHPRRDHRHRLEHASLLEPDLIGRIARLGLAVSTQPLFIASERAWLHKRLGTQRARHAYPLRDLLDAGVLVAGASDAPVESTRVLDAIECCVTRHGFETHQAIGPEEALRMFTLDAARIQHEEAQKGSLTPGKRADLVHLDHSPLDVSPEELGAIQVLRTIVAGRTTYAKEPAA